MAARKRPAPTAREAEIAGLREAMRIGRQRGRKPGAAIGASSKPRRPKRPRRPARTVTAVFPLSSLQSEFSIAGFTIAAPGDHLLRACEIIATRARELGFEWSIRVPLMMRVYTVGPVGYVENYAPPGRPAELELNHPLFGNRRHWYGPPGRPFLRPAAEEKIDAAALEYAKSVDDHARELGWK